MPKKVETTSVDFVCSICNKKFKKESSAQECENKCNEKKCYKNFCTIATSVQHFCNLIHEKFPHITFRIYDLMFSSRYKEPVLTGRVNITSDVKNGLYEFDKENFVGFKTGTGGGSWESQSYDCSIYLNNFPHILSKMKEIDLLKHKADKEAKLYHEQAIKRQEWSSKEIAENNDLKEMERERKELYKRIEKLNHETSTIRQEIDKESWKKFPTPKMPIKEKIDKINDSIFDDVEE